MIHKQINYGKLVKIYHYKSKIRSGKPCISGTRITVSDVLSYLGSGMSIDEIIEDFPTLDKEKITATLSFAAYRDTMTEIAFAS